MQFGLKHRAAFDLPGHLLSQNYDNWLQGKKKIDRWLCLTTSIASRTLMCRNSVLIYPSFQHVWIRSRCLPKLTKSFALKTFCERGPSSWKTEFRRAGSATPANNLAAIRLYGASYSTILSPTPSLPFGLYFALRQSYSDKSLVSCPLLGFQCSRPILWLSFKVWVRLHSTGTLPTLTVLFSLTLNPSCRWLRPCQTIQGGDEPMLRFVGETE